LGKPANSISRHDVSANHARDDVICLSKYTYPFLNIAMEEQGASRILCSALIILAIPAQRNAEAKQGRQSDERQLSYIKTIIWPASIVTRTQKVYAIFLPAALSISAPMDRLW
tara:strand:+ start:764 stop:1102 length:339 start_codon:yes stop_codon:yes gene_type:complete